MSPEPPALLRLLTRAAVLSLVGAIILLAGIWAVEHYGIKVLLFLWAILFLIVALHAGPSLQMPQFTKESHPALKLSQLSTLPQGQLFADAESMRTARREVGRLINVEGRRDAELQHMINSKDENEARLAIQAMKEEGTWPYYALSLLQLGLGSEV